MKIHKGDIAMDMIEDAIDLYNEERFISSLHLSAAASELLSGLSEIYGFESSHQNLKKWYGTSIIQILIFSLSPDLQSKNLTTLKML